MIIYTQHAACKYMITELLLQIIVVTPVSFKHGSARNNIKRITC